MWNLWKLHELNWDFGCVLREFASPSVNSCVNYIISALINSSPRQLTDKLFKKESLPCEVMKSSLTRDVNLEYCQFIFAAAPKQVIEILDNADNLYQCLKSAIDHSVPDVLCADWVLTKIEAHSRKKAEQTVISLINNVLLTYGNLPQSAAYFLFSKLIQYTNEWATFFKKKDG